MSLLAYWHHDLSPFAIRFSENIGIRWYGVAYALGFLGAAWLLTRYARAGRSQLPEAKVWDFIIVIVFGVMLGGRLGFYLLYQPESLTRDPLGFFRVWEGGMASHGGFIGVTIALWFFSRRQKVPFLHLGDLIVSTASLGLMLGRIANFINGELWGNPIERHVPWAVVFPASGDMLPRHPSQIYEALLEGALLLAYAQWRFWRSDIIKLQPGRLSGEFLIGYAVVRIIGETFREPDAAHILGLSRGTFYSIFLIVAGAILIVHALRPSPPVKSR